MMHLGNVASSAGTLFYHEANAQSVENFLIDFNIKKEDNLYNFSRGNLSIIININRIEPGNRFAVITLKVHNFLEKSGSITSDESRRLVTSKYALGIICEPDLAEDDWRRDWLNDLLKISKGLLFDGERLIEQVI